MDKPLNIADYAAQARQRLAHGVYDWYAGGSGDEFTLGENEKAWTALRLAPRVLVDVSGCDLRTTVLGREVSMPIMIAPCSLNVMAHPEGELAVARAAAAMGIVQVVSTGSTYSLEAIAAAAEGTRWFQAYCLRDREVTRDLIQRAEAAGYTAICLTVDSPVDTVRERNLRNQFSAPPPGMRLGNLEPYQTHTPGTEPRQFFCDAGAGWGALEHLRGLTRLPVVVKGVLGGEDARQAVAHGADGILVSNHGGRQLDTALSTCAGLREVADAVGGQTEIFVDGGIRRGTDVLKALALGARAALIGRPFLWGLAVGGEAGVRRVLEILRDELRTGLMLAGCLRPDNVGRRLIARPQFPSPK